MKEDQKDKILPRLVKKVQLIDPHITQKQAMFVALYLDPRSPTYDNLSESYKKAFRKPADYKYGSQNSYKLRNRPYIKNAIAEYNDIIGFGIKERMNILKDIARQKGRNIQKVTAGGKLVEVEEKPRHSDVIRAVEVANKAEGIEEINRAAATQIADRELNDLYDQLRTEIKKQSMK